MLRRLLDPANAVIIFILALVFMYLVMPLYAYYFDNSDEYNLQLATQCFVACIMIAFGAAFPILDGIARENQRKIRFNTIFWSHIIVAAFAVFVLVTFATAESIPIFSYFSGAGANELSEQRGALFKGREGYEIALLYLFTIFTQALMPYAVAIQFLTKDRLRYISFSIFLLFTLSFLQKFLFVSAFIPLMYVYSFTTHKTKRTMIIALFAVPLILYIMTMLSMGSNETYSVIENDVGAAFSADFQPTGALNTLLWRTFAVPVFTATDTLHVFYERLGGIHLNGATSNLIAWMTGEERVNLERITFDYQWGWNDTANANAVYFVDAFVNFGWLGLCVISLIVGQSLRWFRMSEDVAIKSLWPLYCLGLFNATFIGMLFSNAYLLVWFMLLFTAPKAFPINSHSTQRLQPI